MFLALGAASSAIDLLKSLTVSAGSSSASAKTNGTSKTGFSVASADSLQTATTTFGGSSSSGNLSPGTLNALFSAQGQAASTSRSSALQSLFGKLDSDGSGGISKTEFENALGAGGANTAKADEVFGKLDSNGDGAVSLDELGAGLKSGKGHRHHAGNAQDNKSQTDPLLQALDGASSTSSTNSDGSSTTSLTYADGSKVTLTTPAASTATSAATSSYNFIEQAIQRQAQAISAKATSSLSVSV